MPDGSEKGGYYESCGVSYWAGEEDYGVLLLLVVVVVVVGCHDLV